MKDLVSLIMPVITEQYFEESVNSIFKQSYKNWELFILVCCPIKKIQDIVNKFSDQRIVLIKLEKSISIPEAFEMGISKTHGEYVIRHDPDDISLPKRLELQVSYLKEHREAGILSCGIKAFTEDYRYKNQCENINRLQNFYKTKEDIDKAILGGNYPIIFPSLMIRKSLFKDINMLYKKTDFEDEIELALNLLKKSGIEKIENILYYYRRHSNAYHNINQMQRIKYRKNLLNDTNLMNNIRYREFCNELAKVKAKKIMINKSSIFRVLMLVDELNIGGTETYVFNLAKALMEKGIYVVIGSSGGIFEDAFGQCGIKVVRISMNVEVKSIEEIKYLIDMEGINLLHCHLNKSMSLGREIYNKYNIPYVITLHGMFYSKEIFLSSCIAAKAIIAVSSPVKKFFAENTGAEFQGILRVIPNGIDTETFKPNINHKFIRQNLGIPKNAIVILYCSRLGWGKGAIAKSVLSSFKEISLKLNNIYLIILGEGERKENITGAAKELNLSLHRKAVHVIGARYDVLSYYLESDIIIGTGRVVLEALSCERLVIAIGNKGYAGIVGEENKEEMWNLYFGDHEGKVDNYNKNITASMEYLIQSIGKSLKLPKWSREWCKEKFEARKIADEIIGLYKDIIN
ncbi:glycosyltransferase [Clostridium akagii]|uniref:glycosyltransferase n=1 Tax=Clostridium akagii TaxID=91623 RepID=UPI00047EF7AD|nr:glycosyltransferase [Clostridium akagii]